MARKKKEDTPAKEIDKWELQQKLHDDFYKYSALVSDLCDYPFSLEMRELLMLTREFLNKEYVPTSMEILDLSEEALQQMLRR